MILVFLKVCKHQSGVSSTIFKKRVLDLVYSGENHDVEEILRNLIGCLKDWELEKTHFSWEIETLDRCTELSYYTVRSSK